MNSNSDSNQSKYLANTVLKAVALLDALSNTSEELSISDLSDKVGLGGSTTHRLLNTLVSVGYVYKNEKTHRYQLGANLINIGLHMLDRFGVNPEAKQLLRELAVITGETAKLGTIVDGKMIYLCVIESEKNLRTVYQAGDWAPAHCTAMGKVLLSVLPLEKAQAIISKQSPCKKFTHNTITENDALLNELVKIGQQGYAIDDQEYVFGSRGIAVVVHSNIEGKIPNVAVSIAGPSIRLSVAKLVDLLPPMNITATKLSNLIL